MGELNNSGEDNALGTGFWKNRSFASGIFGFAGITGFAPGRACVIGLAPGFSPSSRRNFD